MAIRAKKIQPAKAEAIENTKKAFADYSDFIFADYRGLTVEQITSLRDKLREKDAVLKVVKNNFARIAFEDMKVEKGTYVFAEDPFYELDDDLTEFTLPEPTKEGASFVGWIDLSGKAVFSKSSVYAKHRYYTEDEGERSHSRDVSYYAGLVFYDSDNKIISKNNYALNTASSQIVIPTIQVEEGFQFEAWINKYN